MAYDPKDIVNKANRKEQESKKSVLFDIVKAIVIAGGLGIAAFFGIKEVKSAEFEWIPDYPYVWIGAEYNVRDVNLMCHPFADNSSWNGNVGLRQAIFDYGALRMNGVVQHHSCAFDSDFYDYDAVGFNFELDTGKLFGLK